MTEHQAVLFCTFCARPQTDVGLLITAPDGSTAICDDCVDSATAIVDRWKEDRRIAAAQAKDDAAWREREANPEWQKGLHTFNDQAPTPDSRDSPV
jgi:hypothetical protein